MATQLIVPEDLNTQDARLPAAYQAARVALANCQNIDECKSWSDKAQALASYARQADDDELEKQAVRIRSRAIRRCGELLREFDARPRNAAKQTDATDTLISQRQAAADAGMSERQQVTAVRVANVPAEEFEAAVESAAPPTVTKLADWGRKPQAKPEWFREMEQRPVHPCFHAANVVFKGHTWRLAEFCQKYPPAHIAEAVGDHHKQEMRRDVAKIRRWLKQITPMLRSR